MEPSITVSISLSFLFRASCSHDDTLGAAKKSGVPYILTSFERHRQTPEIEHDQKTRHVGLAHVAQLRTPLYFNELAILSKSVIRCCVRAGGLSGLPSSSVLALKRARRPFSQGSEVLPSASTSRREARRKRFGFGPVAGARCRPPICVSFPLLLGSFRLQFCGLKLH